MRLFDYTYDELVVSWCAIKSQWKVTGVKEPYGVVSDDVVGWHRTRDEATVAAKKFAFAPDFESHEAFEVRVMSRRNEFITSFIIASWDDKPWFDRLSVEKQNTWLYSPSRSARYLV